MNLRWAVALLALAGLGTAGARASGFGFTVTSATVTNNDVNGNGMADIGDTFTVTGAKISSYLSSGAAPAITDNDLALYSTDFSGRAVEVVGNEVRYAGNFTVTYSGPALTAVVESGTADFWATYNTTGAAVLRGAFRANPGVEPGLENDPNFTNTDFSPYNPGRFFGVYTPTPGNPATGSISANLNAGQDGFAASLHNATLTNNDANGDGMAQVGETFTLTSPIASFYPLSDGMLSLTDNDLSRYSLTLNGAVTAVSGRSVTYGGTYTLRYTGPAYPGGVDIETGTFTLGARYAESSTGAAKLTGELIAANGVPAAIQGDPNFKNTDFAVFNPGRFTGTYMPAAPGAGSGTVSGTLTGGVLGFSATVGAGTIVNGDANGNGIADVGETFTATGPLAAYMAVGAPPLVDKDLNRYSLNLNGTAASVAGTSVTYTGTFTITYTGPAVTADIENGSFTIVAAYNANGTAELSGTLNANVGAATPTPPFNETDYAAFNSAVFRGFYTSAGATGTFFGNLTAGTQVQTLVSRKVGAAIEGSPTAATSTADVRYALVASGSRLYAIDPATGYDASGWEGGKALNGRVIGSGRPAVLGNQVFVGTDTGWLYRFDLITGAELNSGQPGGAGSRILTTPAPVEAGAVDQVVVVLSNLNGGTSSAIVRVPADSLGTPSAGPQVLSVGAITTSSPAVPQNGNIFVGTNAGLFVLDYATLTIKQQTADVTTTSPLVANRRVWLATGNGAALRVLDVSNANQLAAYNLQSPLMLSAFYDQPNGFVYAGVFDGRVLSFTPTGDFAGLALPGLFNPEVTGSSYSMPVAANHLMFRATQNKQLFFGLPLNGDEQGEVDFISALGGALAATGQTPGADFVIGSSADGYIHTMSLPGVDVPLPQTVAAFPMNQQINVGAPATAQSPNSNAIYIPNFGPAGAPSGTLSFPTEGGVGFARATLPGDQNTNPAIKQGWYYLYLDTPLAGVGPVDMSQPGTKLQFDTRIFHHPTTNSAPYADAPVFVRLYTYSGANYDTLVGYKDYGVVYATQQGDAPYPAWTTVTIDVNNDPATGGGTFDPSKVTRIRWYGTDWKGSGDDFVDVKNVKVVVQP